MSSWTLPSGPSSRSSVMTAITLCARPSSSVSTCTTSAQYASPSAQHDRVGLSGCISVPYQARTNGSIFSHWPKSRAAAGPAANVTSASIPVASGARIVLYFPSPWRRWWGTLAGASGARYSPLVAGRAASIATKRLDTYRRFGSWRWGVSKPDVTQLLRVAHDVDRGDASGTTLERHGAD